MSKPTYTNERIAVYTSIAGFNRRDELGPTSITRNVYTDSDNRAYVWFGGKKKFIRFDHTRQFGCFGYAYIAIIEKDFPEA